MTETEQYIKEMLDDSQSCLFQLRHKGHEFCYLLADICENQSHEEYLVGLLPNRIIFKKCKLGDEYS